MEFVEDRLKHYKNNSYNNRKPIWKNEWLQNSRGRNTLQYSPVYPTPAYPTIRIILQNILDPAKCLISFMYFVFQPKVELCASPSPQRACDIMTISTKQKLNTVNSGVECMYTNCALLKRTARRRQAALNLNMDIQWRHHHNNHTLAGISTSWWVVCVHEMGQLYMQPEKVIYRL